MKKYPIGTLIKYNLNNSTINGKLIGYTHLAYIIKWSTATRDYYYSFDDLHDMITDGRVIMINPNELPEELFTL